MCFEAILLVEYIENTHVHYELVWWFSNSNSSSSPTRSDKSLIENSININVKGWPNDHASSHHWECNLHGDNLPFRLEIWDWNKLIRKLCLIFILCADSYPTCYKLWDKFEQLIHSFLDKFIPMTSKNTGNMQQLVSYQTARRIYGERSYKKYVTKRTCISLTFSIGFFTLIVGKLCTMWCDY